MATNIATGALPDVARPYLWIAWPVAITLAALTMAIELVRERGEGKDTRVPGGAVLGKGSEPNPEQAFQVHARMLAVDPYGSGRAAKGIRFGVINDSDAPIFDVFAKVPGGRMELRAASIGPGEVRSTEMHEIDMLNHIEMFGDKKADNAPVGVSFVDRNGVRWSRMGYHAPNVLAPSVPSSSLFPGIPVAWKRRPPG